MNLINLMFNFNSRHEVGSNNETLPRFTDRLVLDRALRGRLGPGGKFFSFFHCLENSFSIDSSRHIKS
jgi:hypothetical protein